MEWLANLWCLLVLGVWLLGEWVLAVFGCLMNGFFWGVACLTNGFWGCLAV